MEFLNVSCLSARLPVRVRVSLSLAVLRGEVCISLISLLVPFLHFAIVQESTIELNLQIHNSGRRDTHAMAQEFQQTHLCGIVELGSARPSVSCLSVPRIKKVDCKDRAQPTPEAGLDFLHYKGKKQPYQPALPMEWEQASTYLLGPLINSPPAHPDTVLTSVVYMMKSLQKLGMTYAQLSPYMQLCIQACRSSWAIRIYSRISFSDPAWCTMCKMYVVASVTGFCPLGKWCSLYVWYWF